MVPLVRGEEQDGTLWYARVVRNVVYLTNGTHHPGPRAQKGLFNLLTRVLKHEPQRCRRLAEFDSFPETDLCIAYFHHPADRPEIVDVFDSFVTRGGSLYAIHGVLASFKGNHTFANLLGGVFSGHGPVDRLKVTQAGGADEFRIVDEPYEISMVSDVTVTRSWHNAHPQQGRAGEAPVAWTRSHGDGTVLCLSLGHRAQTWASAGVERILAEALPGAESNE